MQNGNGYQLLLGRQTATPTPAVFTSPTMVPEKNPKSQLMEFFQKRSGTPQFNTKALTQPPAEPSFKCVLICPAVSQATTQVPETQFEGTGRSKKLAEQSACNAALEFYRSKRLINSFRPLQQSKSPPMMPTMAEPHQIYTTMASPTPVHPVAEAAPCVVTLPATAPMQPFYQSSMEGVYFTQGYPAMRTQSPGSQTMQINEVVVHQPIVPNGVVHAQPQATYLHPTMSPPVLEPNHYHQVIPAESYHQNGYTGNDSGSRSSQSEMSGDDNEGENLSLDNSDIDGRRDQIMSCTNINTLQDIALEAIDEILQLREELFEVTIDNRRHVKALSRVSKLSRELSRLMSEQEQ